MLAIKLNKSLQVAGAFCALAMSVNTVLGITEAEFKEKHDRLVEKLIPMGEKWELPEFTAKFVAQRAGFVTAISGEAYSICYLLCLNYSPNVILWLINERRCSPGAVIRALERNYEDLEPGMHEILDTFATYSGEWS